MLNQNHSSFTTTNATIDFVLANIDFVLDTERFEVPLF